MPCSCSRPASRRAVRDRSWCRQRGFLPSALATSLWCQLLGRMDPLRSTDANRLPDYREQGCTPGDESAAVAAVAENASGRPPRALRSRSGRRARGRPPSARGRPARAGRSACATRRRPRPGTNGRRPGRRVEVDPGRAGEVAELRPGNLEGMVMGGDDDRGHVNMSARSPCGEPVVDRLRIVGRVVVKKDAGLKAGRSAGYHACVLRGRTAATISSRTSFGIADQEEPVHAGDECREHSER